MKTKTINNVMHTFLVISGAAILVGSIFKLQHYPNGNLILYLGFLSNFILSSFEINRLKKIIAKSDTTAYEHSNR